MVKLKSANNPNKLQYKLKELIKFHVFAKNIHDIKQEISVDFGGEFEMIGKLSVGDQIRESHIRFRNFTVYEHYINAIDEGYDAEDAIFNGYIFKLDTLQINLVNRSQYGNRCDFKQENIQYRVKDCFIPTKAY